MSEKNYIEKIEKWASKKLKVEEVYLNKEIAQEAINYLKKQKYLEYKNIETLIKNNFISVKLHELNFIDQVQLFHDAECVIGLHGGGFANIVFCKPKTKIIELRGIHSGKPIENLAKKNDLNYTSIAVEAKQSFPNQQGHIQIPIGNLSKVLENK